MPVDRLFLQFQYLGLNALRIIAMATQKKAMKVDLLTPLSSKALQEQRDLANEYRQQKKSNFIWPGYYFTSGDGKIILKKNRFFCKMIFLNDG
jgi:hypothetical protein